jgi:hypothetical protein
VSLRNFNTSVSEIDSGVKMVPEHSYQVGLYEPCIEHTTTIEQFWKSIQEPPPVAHVYIILATQEDLGLRPN